MNPYLMVAMLGSAVICPLSLVVLNTKGTVKVVALGLQLVLLVGQITCLVIGINQ